MHAFGRRFCANPYPAYEALRAAGPLHWNEAFCGGAWLLTNYDDVLGVLRDARFSTQRASRWINSSLGDNGRAPCRAELVELGEFKRIFARSLLFLNGGHHARTRKLMQAGFKPACLQAAAPRIRDLMHGAVARMESALRQGETVDFIGEFARPLPAQVIASLLGIDSEMETSFIAWSGQIAEFFGAPTPTMEVARRAQAGLVAMNEYFHGLVEARRAHAGDDLVSQLIRAAQASGHMTAKELLAQCCTLLFAGHETTRNLLGNGMLHLLGDAVQRQALVDDPALMQSALKELLRFDSPVQFTGRMATCDVELHGIQLRKGQLVIPLIGAANRDPARFAQPDKLNFSRNDGNHLSFGYGAHVCLGAMLSYMEGDIAFTALLPLLAELELASDTPDWGDNPAYRGLAHLPIRLRT
jgi:cytochrome P450